MDTPLHEDRLTPLGRRIARVRRAAAWALKGLVGKPRTVLVEIRWRLGDEIMALPMYAAIKQQWPGVRLVAHVTHAELLAGNRWVDAVNTPCERPDRYRCLRDASRTERRIAHYARLAGVPTPTDPPRLTLDASDPPAVCRDLPTTPFVAVSTGASWPTKRWETARWRELVTRVQQAGHAVVELGQAADPGAGTLGAEVSLVGRTTVGEAAQVLHRARVFTGPDSGLMHLALAVGTPAVAIFGPTDPAVLVGPDAPLHAIRNGRPCQGCWNGAQRMQTPGVCPLSIPDCLETISVEGVADAVLAAMTTHAAAPA